MVVLSRRINDQGHIVDVGVEERYCCSNHRENNVSKRQRLSSLLTYEVDTFGFSLQLKYFVLVLVMARLMLGFHGSKLLFLKCTRAWD